MEADLEAELIEDFGKLSRDTRRGLRGIPCRICRLFGETEAALAAYTRHASVAPELARLWH